MSEISPLFALHAEELLEKGDPAAAIELCLKGLQEYPDYTSAYSVLARAQKLAGDREEAVKTLRNAEQRFPANRAISFYKKNLEDQEKIPEKEKSPVDVIHKAGDRNSMAFLKMFRDNKEFGEGEIRASDVNLIPGLNLSPIGMTHFTGGPEDHIEKLPVPPAFPEIPAGEDEDYQKELENQKAVFSDIISDGDEIEGAVVSPVKHNLSDIARQLNDLSAPEDNLDADIGNEERSFVTETIAGIYEAQGAYEAALEAYSELAGKFPDKEEYYNKKIKEIKAKI